MSKQNENIFSYCVGGYKSEKELKLTVPRINAKIQKANIELKESGGEDEDAKKTLHRYKKMLEINQNYYH